jgi:hypothetical protein
VTRNVQMKDASISEIKGAAKAMGEAAKKEYKRNVSDMNIDFATSAYNLSLSLPDLSHCTGWRPEWNAHTFHMTANGIEGIKNGMRESATQDEGVQALLSMIKKEKN